MYDRQILTKKSTTLLLKHFYWVETRHAVSTYKLGEPDKPFYKGLVTPHMSVAKPHTGKWGPLGNLQLSVTQTGSHSQAALVYSVYHCWGHMCLC